MVTQLNVELAKAKDGRDYIQILSEDFTDTNVVLIADRIVVTDNRGDR